MATRNRLLVLLLQTSKLITILFCPLVHFWTSTVRILFCRLVHIWTSTVVQGDLAPVCVSRKFSLDDSPICLICYNYRPEEVNTSNTCFFFSFWDWILNVDNSFASCVAILHWKNSASHTIFCLIFEFLTFRFNIKPIMKNFVTICISFIFNLLPQHW